MYRGIFDTHAHYDDARFDEDRDALLQSLPEKGVVRVINCGVDLATSKTTLALAHKYDFVYAAVGFHPEDCGDATDTDFAALLPFYSDPKVVAVGEIGLDYYWDTVPKEQQKAVFERQLILANELNKPVIVHDREAHADTLALLKRHRPKGVLHCFSGSVESMEEAVKLGLYIGLGGAVTFKNAKKPLAVAAAAPADRLLLETDCPYMAPVPFRGKRNESSLIAYVAEVIASVRGVEVQQLIDQCRENANRLFGID